MSKARTLADFISDGSEFADGTISVAEVSGAAPLASPTFTGTASGTFSGPLTGNVTGNVTGDLTGDVTGNVTGNLTGNVTGDVAGDIDLSAIAATIADTAVDIFVYDTRKDSDGGAWRKRTQGTSWYNETLNTATRGSRKEFPAVAVIVAESGTVTIYDGDDPDLPMWMVFNEGTASYISSNGYALTSVSAFNGMLVVGTFRLQVINFVSDSGWKSEDNWYYYSVKPISSRNDTYTTGYNNTGPRIVNNSVNDVAMTVLPNAPIDAATGLPVPTIAVATDGGVSVIKDDGTVVDITGGIPNTVVFTPENKLFFDVDIVAGGSRAFRVLEIPDADLNIGLSTKPSGSEYYTTATFANTYPNDVAFLNGYAATAVPNAIGFRSATSHLALIDPKPDANTKAMISFITSDYNTGWMPGDIKLATLSDTDATNVTGSELVTNGTFDTDTSGWNSYVATLSNVSSALRITLTGNNGWASQGIATEVGKTYTVSFDLNAKSVTTFWLQVGTTTNADVTRVANTAFTSTGSHSVTFTATTTTSYVFLRPNGGSGSTADVDNISVRLAEEDRSVNGKGLQVFGTVTKSAVSSGADLVAYSGFSTSNFLRQPYNSDLDLGTGDLAVTLWFKTSGSGYLYERMDAARTGNRLRGFVNSTNIQFFVGSSTGINAAQSLADGVWHHYCGVIRNGQMFLYIDGAEVANASASSLSVTNTDATLTLGARSDNGSALNGSLSLFRFSATAPSPEQIKKIYEDEKVLFQDNAQATLYGSSDAVTALAYDDTTDLLHVGTSDGRSVFQGLRRVDNTTTAVGAAISASGGLVADE